MAQTYYTFRICLANEKSVQVEKFGDRHESMGGTRRTFRYEEKREEIESQLQPVLDNTLNNTQQARELGETLFEAIFDDVLRQEFVNFYQDVVRNQKQLLRIELDIDEQAMPNVAALPWEFMCLPASLNLGGCRLATNPNLVFSRRRLQSYPPNLIRLENGEKLRIALAIAAPRDLEHVEYQEVEEALKLLAQEQGERIELLPVVNPATPIAINHLLEQKPHIFHFIGHGQMQNEAGEDVGQIALVRKILNRALWVDANFFSELFEQWTPGVVMLQACESGMLSASKAFAGAASKIVQMNIPVVVAMQYKVSNATASEFACEFYERLAKGEPVDVAAQKGRRIIGLDTVYRKRDFATPIIFMGVEDASLFKSPVISPVISPERVRFTDIVVKGSSQGNQENSPDLDFSGMPLESIQEAYRQALPPDANLWGDGNLEENDISQILERLKKFGRMEVFYEVFYQVLSQDNNPSAQMDQEIQAEENQARETGNVVSEEQKYYLIITISSEPADNNQFTLHSWLVMGEYEDYSKYLNNCQSLLNSNETESGIKCQLSQVENFIDRFIQDSSKPDLSKKEIKELTIEIFLPIDLLHTEVEWWNFTDFDNSKRPIGTMYPVRLRSVERLHKDYLKLYLNKWKKKWKKTKSVLKQQPTWEYFGHFDLIENENFIAESLIYELHEKIGFKSTSCPPQQKRKDLFKAILKSAIPIALWTRYNCPNRHQEIEHLLNWQPLNCLCDSIKKKRMNAVAQKDEIQKKQHLGSHLAVIWENPYRLTPHAIARLMAPGQ